MLDNHYVPEGYGLIPNIMLFGQKISSYTLFVGLGLLIGIVWFMISVPRNKKISIENSFDIVITALIFGFVGSKILVIIENLNIVINDFSAIKGFLFNGKSIIGGLLGGYLGVRFIKKRKNIQSIRTGNKIAPSIALGMGIGRIGCFLTGCCYGIKTNLPIGIDFGDGINRIPTQLIEMVFCFGLFGYLLYKQQKQKNLMPGILFKELVLYYFIFRFLIEFIRGTSKIILFLSIYQIICIFGIIYMINQIKKEKKLWKLNKIYQ